MATPLTVAIPLLRDNQTIAAWQPLFVAAVATMEERAAVKLLPAYVKRGRLEEKVVLGAVSKDTLDEAFTYLKERLDPEEDVFDSAARFRSMAWVPGEPVQDFFVRYLEEAIKAGISAKSACVFMVSQVPLEVRTKLKDWVKAKGDGLDSDGALQFSIVVRKTLVEKGIPLDQGCRIQRVHDKVSLVETTPEEVESDGSSSQATTPPSVQRIQSRYKQPIVSQRTRSEPLKCYACGSSNHLIRRCPNKRCYVCGEAGHKPFDCPNKTRKTVDHKRRVYQVSTGEESVTIRVGIGSQDVAAMLDTGAKPSVMDIDTAGQLQLAGSIVPSTSKVYGLCDNPVRVRGYVDAHIRIGNYESVVERIQVIDSKEPLLLLGRSFMEQHGAITFDWDNRRIRLGRTWVPIEDSLSGAKHSR